MKKLFLLLLLFMLVSWSVAADPPYIHQQSFTTNDNPTALAVVTNIANNAGGTSTNTVNSLITNNTSVLASGLLATNAVTTIPSVATLASVPASVKAVTTLGLLAAGDGGGATYISTTNLLFTSTNMVFITNMAGAYWTPVDVLQKHLINVRWFGATNGTASDQQPALQAALTASCQFAAGGNFGSNYTVFLPDGVFRINSTLVNPYATGSGYQAYNNVRIQGTGGTEIRYYGSANTPALFLDRCTAAIDGITFYTLPYNTPTDYVNQGIYLSNCYDYSITGCAFYGFSRGIVDASSVYDFGVIDGCKFQSCTIGAYFATAKNVHLKATFEACGTKVFAQNAVGASFDVGGENTGGNASIPFGFVLTSGTGPTLAAGYSEGDAVYPLAIGVPITNSVSLSSVGTAVSLTFTNAHFFASGVALYLTNSTLAGADATALNGWHLLNSGTTSNNILGFTAASSITGSYAGLVFKAAPSYTNCLVNGFTAPAVYVAGAAGPAMFDNVIHPVVNLYSGGSSASPWMYTTTTLTIDPSEIIAEGTGYALQVNTNNVVPVDMFPDPYLWSGTNWMSTYVSVNNTFGPKTVGGIRGYGTSLSVTNALVASHTSVFTFQPNVAIATFPGRRIAVSAWFQVTTNGASSGNSSMAIRDQTGAIFTTQPTCTQLAGDANGWQFMYVTGTVPAGTTSFQLYVQADAYSVVTLANIHLCFADNCTPAFEMRRELLNERLAIQNFSSLYVGGSLMPTPAQIAGTNTVVQNLTNWAAAMPSTAQISGTNTTVQNLTNWAAAMPTVAQYAAAGLLATNAVPLAGGTMTGTLNVPTVALGTGTVTNNIGLITSTALPGSYVDVVGQNPVVAVAGAVTITYATNGVAGQSWTGRINLRNYSGGNQTLTIPSGWKTNFFTPVPPALTNGTTTIVWVTADGVTSSATTQTNCVVDFSYYK